MQTIRLVIAFALVATSAACTGTVGPYISDINELPDGRLAVTRCTSEVTHTVQIVVYANNRDCTTKTIGRSLAVSTPAVDAGAGTPTP